MKRKPTTLRPHAKRCAKQQRTGRFSGSGRRAKRRNSARLHPRATFHALLASIVLAGGSTAAALELPNARVTPGAVGTVDGTAPNAARVCVRGMHAPRHRYDAHWRRYRTATFRAYGIPHAEWSRYTVDHLAPIELGSRPFGIIGRAWDLRNIWPEPKTKAEQKDAVENALHAAVCYRGGYRGLHHTLEQADAAFSRDWTRTPVGLPVLRGDE